ncbi:Long-chain-fatty-acid--CoA ligase [Ascidiaceihabitans donghaensis]|uniref:Long-chain-fatty-acid--CoA ligase n=1 Tax=Ascidiaceihabitans donghaensis TaxID=1510460 RepID=A0A2R8BC63_9RHOB|nr:Long-chain-fatty-acid--CoA ligase [Ascidiaceihabitans donghaensis]
MFHCNGWCFPWTLWAIIGTHVCLRQVRAEPIWAALADEKVTHLCSAPIIMSLLISASSDVQRVLDHTVQFVTASSPLPEKLLADMKTAGFDVTYLYGLTETYGPAVVNDWDESWSALPSKEKARLKSR